MKTDRDADKRPLTGVSVGRARIVLLIHENPRQKYGRPRPDADEMRRLLILALVVLLLNVGLLLIVHAQEGPGVTLRNVQRLYLPLVLRNDAPPPARDSMEDGAQSPFRRPVSDRATQARCPCRSPPSGGWLASSPESHPSTAFRAVLRNSVRLLRCLCPPISGAPRYARRRSAAST
jgi:hypothetical protein